MNYRINLVEKYFPKEKRYFKVLDRNNTVYDDFEQVPSIEADDHEDAAEKYAEQYYNDCGGEWEQDEEITFEVYEVLQERTYNKKEQPKKFVITLSYDPSFFSREIKEDEE